MICDINAPLAEKLTAIRERTPDQQMARDGVPVSIGGKAFEIRPMTRSQARQFKLRQWQYIHHMAGTRKQPQDDEQLEALIAHEDRRAELYAAIVTTAIPELEGKEAWFDEQATDLELYEAMSIQDEFNTAVPNIGGAEALNPLNQLASLMSTPSSPNSTRPTRKAKSTTS